MTGRRGLVWILGLGAGRAHLVAMRPAGLELDLRPVLQVAVELLDGKGGGRPDRVQGSGPRADRLREALTAARGAVVKALGGDPATF